MQIQYHATWLSNANLRTSCKRNLIRKLRFADILSNIHLLMSRTTHSKKNLTFTWHIVEFYWACLSVLLQDRVLHKPRGNLMDNIMSTSYFCHSGQKLYSVLTTKTYKHKETKRMPSFWQVVTTNVLRKRPSVRCANRWFADPEPHLVCARVYFSALPC